MSSLQNLTGKKFGKLTVLRKGRGVYRSDEGASVSWICSCSCGKELDVPKYNLIRKHGGKTHCGCSPDIRKGLCANCNENFSSTRLRVCQDGVLRCKKCTPKHTRIQRKYGLTLTGYNIMLERQGGVCSICKEDSRLVVDHDHVTKKIRGLLCVKCNLLLGYVNDNLTTIRSAQNYLLRSSFGRDWGEYFLDIAELSATRSKDMSTQCGSVIVKDRNILSTGYNGFPRGWNDGKPENHDRPLKYDITIHAEVNSIINASRHAVGVRGASLYVTPIPPCHDCAKAIIQAGIAKVIVRVSMKNKRWFDSNDKARLFFSECGVAYEERT